ncbi:MAG: condensation domain-containing protein, partial [Pyrinomonadaceae bacterium]
MSSNLSGSAPAGSSLVELLRLRAQSQPGQRVYSFQAGRGQAALALTLAELDERARGVAALLQRSGAEGERVLLLYPPGLDYITAFFGCLYAGAVAVPAYPPGASRKHSRLRAIILDSSASTALAAPSILSNLESLSSQVPELKGLRWLSADGAGDHPADAWRNPGLGPDSLAFLQYTSGSTASPKGVMLTHENLLANLGLMHRSFELTPADRSVIWLPPYHDMGLIGGILQPVYSGFAATLLSPLSFLQNPARWLEEISANRATISGGPNFAYDLCVRSVGQGRKAALDLSCWEVAFNGAEPVRAETLDRFAEAFAPCGFRREAFYPCYGLAEASLLVAGGGRSTAPSIKRFDPVELERGRAAAAVGPDAEGARPLVSCGVGRQETVIISPSTATVCRPGEVGEVWVHGPSVAGGYWGRPDETTNTFHAYLADAGGGPYLRTGDLGFLAGGELFITGRLKDLIIIRGRNLYAHDVERAVEESHGALRPGCGAAFAVEEGGEERLVVVHEVERRAGAGREELLESVRRALAEEFEVQPAAVVLVKPGVVPKTSSGKIQRRACRELFLTGQLEPLAMWRAADAGEETAQPVDDDHSAGDIEARLKTELAARLGVAEALLEADKPVLSYGLDSLMAIELSHSIEARYGVAFPVLELLGGESLAQLAARPRRLVEESAAGAQTEESAAAETHPLSYGQEALWLLHRIAPDSAAYNVAAAARVRGPLDATVLRDAFRALAERHPSLRTTFEARDGSPVQLLSETGEVSFEQLDASGLAEAEWRELLAERAQRPFDLAAGPLLRVGLLERAADEHILLLVAHHIVIDFWSLAILLRELGALYETGLRGETANLTPPSGSYADYVRRQRRMLEGAEGARLWDFWSEELEGELLPLDLPTDRPRPPVQTYNGASHAARLDADLVQQLRALERESGATLYMLLLAAFQVLLAKHTGQEEVVVGSPSAGRGRAAEAGVVGYFVNPLALRTDLSGDPTFEELLRRVRRTVRDALAHQEFPFPLLVRRLQPERDASRPPLFQAMFVLQQTALLRAEGVAAFALGVEGARMKVGGLDFESIALERRVAQFDLTLSAAEAGGGLLVSWEYNTDLFNAETVERMAGRFAELLRGVVEDPRRRLSDLPLLTAGERRLLAEWNRTSTDYAPERPLHAFFEEQAAANPDAAAVLCGQERLNYAELNRRADALARELLAHGVGPETLVGVMLERSFELVVALLGVLKAGAAYVPLDPAYPAERLAFMLEDSGAPLLLTQERLLTRLPQTGAEVVCLDANWEAVAERGAARPSAEAPPPADDNLAYVIYTSGSTGRPKGV